MGRISRRELGAEAGCVGERGVKQNSVSKILTQHRERKRSRSRSRSRANTMNLVEGLEEVRCLTLLR